MLEPKADWPRTLEEFRVWHERQPEVYEFIDGVPRLMTPGSKAHTIIKGNVGRALGNALEGTDCQVLVDGAQIEGPGFSVVPDVVVACGPPDLSTPRVDDPDIIIEILSPSSEKDDIGRKQALYLGIASLRHYLVIHQDRRLVVHHERRDDLGGGVLTRIAPPDPIRLDPPGIALALDAIYAGLPPPPGPGL